MNTLLKNCCDRMVSALALILLFPLLLAIAVVVRLDSEGSVLFKQKRLSKNGKVFTMLKFRSMVVDAEHQGTRLFNYKDDPRVTRIGRFLRRSSLDELPQLINVLRGEMSLVGPRPCVVNELGDFDTLNPRYKKRFAMLPGITGYAQVNGRNEIPWDEKVKLDNEYIELFQRQGVWLDIKILMKTAANVLASRNICEVKTGDSLNDRESAEASEREIIAKAHAAEGEEEAFAAEKITRGSIGSMENDPREERLIWLDGELVQAKDARINVLSPTSQFGLNVFEGIRCYWNEERQQLYAFRLTDHYARLKRSQRLLKMEDRYTAEELQDALIKTVKANGYREDIAVRQTLFVDGFGSWSSRGPVHMFVSPIPKAQTSPEYQKAGLNCCISSWQRIGDNVLPPRIKCGANYINSRLAQLEALDNGYDTVIFLNQHGRVAEGPGSCVFMVRDGTLITPLITDSVLESITRDTIMTLAYELGIQAVERTVDRTELYICDEAFLCGSSMEITPVVSVDGYKVGNGSTGAVTGILHEEYRKAVTGRLESHRDWLTGVY